ncbi:MAG: hypothetical protein IT210_02110 [Armatimonadetes bacterium]|nr:hypothetical protein [Armatimonadota bacterium]
MELPPDHQQPPERNELTTGQKIGHFLAGLFGIWFADFLIVAIVGGLSSIGDYAILFFAGSAFMLLFNIAIIVRLYKGLYRFIAIGMIAGLILPALAFGACYMALSTMRFE